MLALALGVLREASIRRDWLYASALYMRRIRVIVFLRWLQLVRSRRTHKALLLVNLWLRRRFLDVVNRRFPWLRVVLEQWGIEIQAIRGPFRAHHAVSRW